MSTITTLLVFITVAAMLGFCIWLLAINSKTSQKPEETTHGWDDDLTEYNHPLPLWWLWLFYGTIIFGVIYFFLYPSIGGIEGKLGWSQEEQYQEEVAAFEEKLKPLYEQFRNTPIPELAQDPRAEQLGRSLYANYCAGCHGSDAKGAPGFPNLTDDAWLYGGTPEAITTTLLHGRSGMMPAFSGTLAEEDIKRVAGYVRALSGRTGATDYTESGKNQYAQLCAACHGAEGKGNQALGAPNLTDSAWLYGGSFATVVETLTHGRAGKMPAHEAILGEDKIHVLAAYVYGLSQ